LIDAINGVRTESAACRGSISTAAGFVITPSETRNFNGQFRLRANGRYLVVDTTPTFFSASEVTVINLESGARWAIELPLSAGVQYAYAGRAIADDGTVVLS
jgi:hypothetical protein